MLECKNIACSYGPTSIFEGVNISLENGALVVVHGPNGSGKTSLLQIIAGIKNPTSGSVAWGDQPISEAVQAGDVSVNYVGQTHALKNELTVAENMTFWAEMTGDTSLIPEAIMAFGLEPVQNTPCSKLSDGWKKRAALSKIIFCPADILILDEPYNNLDVKIAQKMDKIIAERSKAGSIIILSSHTLVPIEFADKLNIADYAPRLRAA